MTTPADPKDKEQLALELKNEIMATPEDKIEKTELRKLLESKIDDFATMLSGYMEPERFIISLMNAISRNDKLSICTRGSIFTSAIEAAGLGFDFSPTR